LLLLLELGGVGVGWHLSFVMFFFGFCFLHSSFSLSDLGLLLLLR